MQNKFLLLSERARENIASAIPKDNEINKLATFFANFSDSTRIKILTCLSMSEMCVSDISSVLNINQTTISHQLKSLKDQNIVSFRRDGKILVYFLLSENFSEMMMYAVNCYA